MIKLEVIEAELKVNESSVDSSSFFKEFSTFFIHEVVAHVQAQQMLIGVQTLYHINIK